MCLRAMRHSIIPVVRRQGSRPDRVTPPAIAAGRAKAALLPVVLGNPSTVSPVLAGALDLRGKGDLPTAWEQDDGKPPP